MIMSFNELHVLFCEYLECDTVSVHGENVRKFLECKLKNTRR